MNNYSVYRFKNRNKTCSAALVFLCAVLLRGTIALGTDLPGSTTVQILVRTNIETLYTTYDFVARKDGKKMGGFDWNYWDVGTNICWEVGENAGNPKPKKIIYMWDTPENGSFSANIQINRAIMKEIFSRWPVSDFDSISFIGQFDGPPDWSWQMPIAVASSKSDDYKDFKVHYPNSKIIGLFGLYRQLADENKIYQPIQEVFREFGADLQFDGGEKEILNARAEDLPFYPQLKAAGINGKTRVIYDALGNGFTIKPCPKAQPTTAVPK